MCASLGVPEVVKLVMISNLCHSIICMPPSGCCKIFSRHVQHAIFDLLVAQTSVP